MIVAGAATLVVAAVGSRVTDNESRTEPVQYPALVAIEFIPAGTSGEDIVRLRYVRLEIGGDRTPVPDPIYLLGRPEYAYLVNGETVSDISPGTVLGREHFRP